MKAVFKELLDLAKGVPKNGYPIPKDMGGDVSLGEKCRGTRCGGKNQSVGTRKLMGREYALCPGCMHHFDSIAAKTK